MLKRIRTSRSSASRRLAWTVSSARVRSFIVCDAAPTTRGVRLVHWAHLRDRTLF